MFKTPDYSHISSREFEYVYEPAEDSFLLLDAIDKEYPFIQKLKPSVCLEVGSGSGICITFLAKLFHHVSFCLCTDINEKASELTRQTAERNGVIVEVIRNDLIAALYDKLRNKVDVLIFNPPYVVTPSEEVNSTGIEASWAGGVKGREVTDRFLPQVPNILSKQGVFYLLIIKENDKDDLEKIMDGYNFNMDVVISRRSGPEFLSVLKFTRKECVKI